MASIIKVENLSKQYRLGKIGTGSFRHDLNRWLHTIRGKEDPYLKIGEEGRTRKRNGEYMWALKDVNFEVRKGDVIGIIGKNGAGKSTLLKILSRTTSPTMGSVKIKGRIASLLEVGTGFHPELTGRENIFLNGAILGMTKYEIKNKFDEILDFAGVETYIDTPVKRYSSGMYVRLAFAVAAHLEPEILIVDEVLAVGDAEFQKKAIGRMKQVSKGEGRTVLFVSHNLSAISNLCERCILLKSGKVVKDGTVDSCLELYSQLNYVFTGSSWTRNEPLTSVLNFTEASLTMHGDQPNVRLEISVMFKSIAEHKKAFIAVDIADNMGVVIMQAIPSSIPFIDSGSQNLVLSVDLPPLIPTTYFISLWCGSHNTETFDYKANILGFEVLESPLAERNFPHSKLHGYVIPVSKIDKHDKKAEK